MTGSDRSHTLNLTMDSAAGQDECAVVDAPAAPAPIEEEPEPEQEQEQEPSMPSPVVAEQEPQQPPPPPAKPEASYKAVEEAAGMGGKRKASAERAAEEEAPALKHLKSPGVMLSRRPVPTSGIKPPAIFAPKRMAPSPVPFPTAATAATAAPAACPKPAAAPGSSARKSVAAATTTSHRMSVLSKKVGGQATNHASIHPTNQPNIPDHRTNQPTHT